MVIRLCAAALLLAAAIAWAQKFHVYIGDLGATHALIAWGTTSGDNTIGRSSPSHGRAELRVGGRTVTTDRNWARVAELAPDTAYDYEVSIEGRPAGAGRFRTWAAKPGRLDFFVIGDYGNGSSGQRRVADAMWREFERRESSGSPVRFVLTTGDNIYGDLNLGYISARSGDEDKHWETKFFRPYENILRQVPFFPTLGNHDGNASESRGDLAAYLDNFFFPGGVAARWYEFGYGGLADFFALDTTDNTESGRPRPSYGRSGAQFEWLTGALPRSRAPWKIAYFHHPPFNAGPRHGASLEALAPFIDLLRKAGVAVVFAGHEHNFQFSERGPATGNMLFVVSGAGGELRRGDVAGTMERAHIAGWAPQRHFLAVEIEGRTMRILPVSYEPMRVRDARGENVRIPIVVSLP